jgi:hypothetical protein
MGTYHHGMARPCVLDGGTAFNMEGSCKYIELAVTESWKGTVIQLRCWETKRRQKNISYYKIYTGASDLDSSIDMGSG